LRLATMVSENTAAQAAASAIVDLMKGTLVSSPRLVVLYAVHYPVLGMGNRNGTGTH
jgi:hypothetical protein